jgi:uncharacterized membrane protein YcaP (DUF421 family)
MEIVVRASVIFFVLWVITRALGKRELSQLSAFELVLLVVMGDLVQQGVTQNDHSLTGAALAVGTITIWILTFSYASYRSRRLAALLEGVPSVVLRNGEPLMNVLKSQRLTIAELEEAARGQGIEDLRVVKIAVLEPDGKLSFITSDGQDTPEDDAPRLL